MIRVPPVARATALVALLWAVALPALAQPAASYRNGSEFYLAYRVAFDKATSIDELLPWVAKERREVIAKAPAEERKEGFDMMKMFDDRRSVTVVKETPSATGAELQVEGISAESQAKATGVITLVKEDGAWRIVRESWKGGGR
jgi:glucan biosynthesis protein